MALQPASPRADTIAHRSYLSKASSQRQGSLLVEQIPLTKIPGMLSLGGGMPNPTMFPFASVEVRGGLNCICAICNLSMRCYFVCDRYC